MAPRTSSAPRRAFALLLVVALAGHVSADQPLRPSEENSAAESTGHGPVLLRSKRFFGLGGGLNAELNLGGNLGINHGYQPPNPYGYNYPPYGHNYNYPPNGHYYNYPMYPAAPVGSHSQSSSQASSSGYGTGSYSSSQSAAHSYGK